MVGSIAYENSDKADCLMTVNPDDLFTYLWLSDQRMAIFVLDSKEDMSLNEAFLIEKTFYLETGIFGCVCKQECY